MTRKQALWLMIWLVMGAGNAFLGQLYIDLGAGRIPVSPAVAPYVPSMTAALSFLVAGVGAFLPSLKEAGRD